MILQALDGGVPALHKKYRQLTHDSKIIPKLALIVALCNAEDEDTDYLDVYMDMQKHLEEDDMFNQLIYGGAKNRKEESEEDKDNRKREVELLRELAE